MRVAIRRLRAALVLFKPVLEPHAAEQFDAVLCRPGRVLGEARDWDVFCDETLPAAEAEVAHAGWVGLMREAAQQRLVAAYDALQAEMAGSAITGIALGIAGWAEDEAALGDNTLAKSLSETAPARSVGGQGCRMRATSGGPSAGWPAWAAQKAEETSLRRQVSFRPVRREAREALPKAGQAPAEAARRNQ